MNMISMIGIMVVCYFITLSIIALYRKRIHIKIGNFVFIMVDIVFYFCWNYATYLVGGLEDGFMTLENISPLTFTLMPLSYFMGKRTKEFCFSAIAFLHLGMFLAMIISPSHSYLFNFKQEANFIYASETACHLVAALFGIYLILTKQVKTDFKNWCRSLAFMFSIIAFGVSLNYFFHTRCFFMDPYGNYSIYMLDIFGTFEATLLAYLLGVLGVLTIGMQSGALLNAVLDKISAMPKGVKHATAKEKDEANEENTITI